MFSRVCVLLALALLLVVASAGAPLRAISGTSLIEIESLQLGDWGFKRIALRLPGEFSTTLAANLLVEQIDSPLGIISGLRLRCAKTQISQYLVTCQQLEFDLRLNEQTLSGVGVAAYRLPQKSLRLDLRAHEGGQFRLEISPESQQSKLSIRQFPLQQLPAFIAGYQAGVNDYLFDQGLVDVELAFGKGGSRISLEVTISELALSNNSGTIATEALDIGFSLSATRNHNATWLGQTTISLANGAVYAEPVYADIAESAVSASSEFIYQAAEQRLELPSFAVNQTGVARLEGAYSGVFSERSPNWFESLKLKASAVQFPAAYTTWLAGVMVGTPLAELETAGEADVAFAMRQGQVTEFQVQLTDLSLEDKQQRFALYNINAELIWAERGESLLASQIDLGGGYVYGAPFDATSIHLGIAGAAIDLLEPARIPVLGGALVISHFSLRDYDGEDLALALEAELEPIALGPLTSALQWPAFSGDVAGRLPLLQYHDGVLTLGGELVAHAFDGDITIDGLRIEQPFGLVPTASANIRLRNLDLAQITEVVPFGRISGRLDGDILGLQLVKSEPVAFDASFRTPDDDRSKKRLSQRAVNTISKVAGGGAALSTTFLRIFEHFAYTRLGISCRLVNDVCLMDGVEPADDGYYIVKGALIPRVDLIGRVREVQWSRLMQQLTEALRDGDIKVE